MADPLACGAKVERLKAAGFAVSIDDFGTGFSSLSYLKRFAVDELKIDRSFVSGIEEHASDRAIVAAIVTMAHGLGLRVVAEGVETQAQLDFLRRHDCDVAQGFCFARPMPAEVFTAWMSDRRFL
jgi:EAL domain-containing protein (putative c-di-GMP-specific phosphodiesterase class I)